WSRLPPAARGGLPPCRSRPPSSSCPRRRCRCTRPPSVRRRWRRARSSSEGTGKHADLARPEVGFEDEGQPEERQRQVLLQTCELLLLLRDPRTAELGRGAQGLGVLVVAGIGVETVDVRVQPVDDDRSKTDADAVLQRERRLDQL